MTRVENVKMVALAMLILAASMMSGSDKDRFSDAQPVLPPAPEVRMQVLTG